MKGRSFVLGGVPLLLMTGACPELDLSDIGKLHVITPPGWESVPTARDEQPAPGGSAPGVGDWETETLMPIRVLGDGAHDLSAVQVVQISTPEDDLFDPTDLEFHPDAPGELWVTNRGDSSVVIYHDAGGADQVASKRAGGNHLHFLAKPAALAFGANNMMATAQQEDQVTQYGTPPDFMGPTMWTSDSYTFNGGHATHTDMLHNSPNSSGIAWERDNVYWVYDGSHGAITRYDFQRDHGLGGADHSDGIVWRFADGELGYVPGVPAHVAYDHSSALLYAADPANRAIMVLNTRVGLLTGPIAPNYDGTVQRYVEQTELSMLVDGAALEPPLLTPSGLELHEGILYVGDRDTGRIYAFSLDGELLDWLPTGMSPGLSGLAFDADGSLWVAHSRAHAIYRVSPL